MALVLLVPAAYVPRPAGQPPLLAPAVTQFLFDTALRSDFLFWAAARLAPDTMTRSILGTPPEVVRGASAEERRRVAELLAQILPVSSRRLGLLNDAAVVGGLEGYALDTIGAPTLAVSVEDDGYGTYDAARYSAEHIRGARFIGYPTGGHMLVGHYQEVMAAVADFLRGPH